MGCLLKANGLYSRMTVGAVLLAAGAGRRMGGRPKALLELGGVPLVMRQLVALSGAGVDEGVVVVGHHAEAVEQAIGAFPITVVRNPAPDDGRASSVRLGLQALSPRLDAIIVAPADLPLIDAQDIVALIGAYRKRGAALMVVPRVDGQPGNPIIFDAALRERWLAGPPPGRSQGGPAPSGGSERSERGGTSHADLACRRWRDEHAQDVCWFDTDNMRYRVDVDTPDDLDAFAARTGHRLRWPAAFEEAVR